MEQREYPRVQLPLLVELQHPALGRGRTVSRGRADGAGDVDRPANGERYIARDISEGGVFVHLDVPPSISAGAKLRLTLLNPTSVDNQPTPTVEMVVKRVEDNGLGLAFVNKTSRHLWQSVERLRDELAVGRDYFQVHQSALVVNPQGGLLIVQQHGKWSFPGEYLIVGEDWQSAIKGYLAGNFGLSDLNIVRVLDADSGAGFDLPEAAVFKIYLLVSANSADFSFDTYKRKNPTQRYRNARWVDNRRDIDELTFVGDSLRTLAHQALTWTDEPAD